MKITIYARGDRAETAASVAGDTLTVDGVDYDLSAVQEGDTATVEGDAPFVGPITREGGEIVCAMLWSYDPASAEANQPDVAPVLTVTSGPVPDPVTRRAAE